MAGRFVSYMVFIVFLLCGNNLFSQDKDYIYDHYNISNGLISDNVFKIFTDRSGYIWIITYNGLQKYDGYEFKTYTSNPAIEGTLSSNFVVDIFEDRDGDIIIVLDDGIDIYHQQTDQFKNLLSNLPFAEAKRNEITRQASVVQDKSGSIWTTCHNQLVRIDSTKENFFVYPDEFTGNFVLNHDSTALWIITEGTFKRYDLVTRTLTITNVQDIQSPVDAGKLNTIYVDSKGICWVGTSGGLLKFDEHKISFTQPELNFSKHPGSTRKRFNANITSIYEDYNNDLWVASGNVLSRIDRTTGNIQMLEHETENKNSILKEPITGIYGNRSGING
ncbi:MAG: two-component regulator propeller domain-containing protein [Bacteroidales bacterium]|nr:two-component regulator propeller domain-containing protein [Bacteroidales bacterium]MDT8431643.1 two-component regulator propeller domain-containing protein [Bacteroidales bacterium]